MSDKKKKTLHGNQAKIDPTKHVNSLYATNMVVVPGEDQVPETEKEDQVEYARRFSEENKK